MPRYYFHVKDGYTSLDAHGVELKSVREARDAAVVHSGEVLRDGASEHLWSGEPWLLWVTDQPNGKGKTLFRLNFSAAAEE
jgi:hypothetical protein